MKEQQILPTIDKLLDIGEIKKAEIIIARQLRSNLSHQEKAFLLFRRARSRLLSNRPDDAIQDIAAVRDLSPTYADSPDLLEVFGDCYFARFELASVGFADRNDTLQAQQVYRRIIQDYPKYDNLGWIHYQLGRIHVTLNEFEEAWIAFQQALLNPSHVSALTAYCYERLGFIAYYEQRDLKKAIAFLNRAVDTYPANRPRNWLVQLHLLRSRVLRSIGEYEASLAAAETALSVVSGGGTEHKQALSEALLTISELLSEMDGHDKETIAYLQQFIQNTKKPLGVDVTWSRVNEMLGNAYFSLGQYDQAISAYRAALQFNPDHPWELSLHYRIARSYYHQRNYGGTVEAINRMLERAKVEDQKVNDYLVYDVLGNAQFALGRYDKAIEAYETALEMAPPNAENVEKIRVYYEMARELLVQA